jgi:hypothetical protein
MVTLSAPRANLQLREGLSMFLHYKPTKEALDRFVERKASGAWGEI